ncbi:sigma-54 dependent transcriptional regulator [Shewanella sp. NIFS-20-20]|uniref:sigma-54 dependent transcriptional regulator n=1 Tax=Shewanella sp. NIFS-20-20 TaxID=2853806 RepID=UPI001C481158|nr:sigma-54 dependent transcriptional regulator [Shewanella sp. NIFS-20-20]
MSERKEVEYVSPLQSANFQVTCLPHDLLDEMAPADITIFDLQYSTCLDWLEPLVCAWQSQTMLVFIVERSQLALANIMDMISLYAWDYHTAPVDIDRFMVTIGRIRGMLHMRQPWLKRRLKHLTALRQPVTCSAAMQKLQRQVLKVAPTELPVLVIGPSGAGKELVARKVHQHSARAQGPLVILNCGAIPLGLSNSELFGHEKGAFTGACQRHLGKLTQADGGTLFLDEIGDLPMELQTHLLRFLQEGCFDVVGGTTRSADVRVVAATHIDLQQAIATGKFRLDLFYRLNGVTLQVPSLRDRMDDIPELARSLLQEAAASMGGRSKPLSEQAMIAIIQHDWPGNVRELINRLRRALVMAEGVEITPKDLDLADTVQSTGACRCYSLQYHKEKAERQALNEALLQTGGQVNLAAKNLQVSRATLYRLLDKYDLLT